MDNFDIGQSVEEAFDVVFRALPAVFGALLVLVIGYFVAKFIDKVLRRSLKRLNFDKALFNSPAGTVTKKLFDSPAQFVGTVGFWVVMIGVISLAVSVLGIPALTNFVAAIYGYLPSVLAAILIFLTASAVSAGVVAMVRRVMADTPTGDIIAAGAPAIIMSIAGFMILNQLGIATAIVTITYATIMGSIGLGLALAFGLGGRDVAAKILENTYERGQANFEQAKKDVELGRERAKKEVSKARKKLK